MANRLPLIAVIVAVLAFLAWSSIFVVNERQQAIVLRFGEIVDVKSEPGIYFKAPFSFIEADNVQMIEDRVLRFDLDDIRVQVSGGRFYEVDAFIAYRISDPRRFRLAVSGSVPLAEQRLRTRLDAALRRVYGLRGFEAALSEERGSMMREVRDQLRPDATSLGLEIVDVRIRRTDLTQEVSQQTYERMRAERLAEAERLRARGREAAQRIRARVDREVVEIVADARRESEILRGEGGILPLLRQRFGPPARCPGPASGGGARSGGERDHHRRNRVSDLFVAIGLVLVIEGVLYGGLPQIAKRLAAEVLVMPEGAMRVAGLAAMVAGVAVVWFVRG